MKRRDFLLSTAAAVVAPALPVQAEGVTTVNFGDVVLPEAPGRVYYGWQMGFRGGIIPVRLYPDRPTHSMYFRPLPKEDTPCT
jgi:hypothetical protein